MRKPHLKLDEETRSQLCRRRDHAPTKNERWRAQAMLWLDENKTITEVARLLGLNRQRITRALKRFRQEGRAGLPDRPRSGRRPCLPAPQQLAVVSWLGQSPRERGWSTNSWTLVLLQTEIERSFGVRCSHQSVHRLLQRHGCRRVRPHHRLARADPAAKRGQPAGCNA